MDKEKLEKLETLMEKIRETMRISKEKQALIDNKEKELYEETRIMMVEKGKAELEELKKEKKEFDEMTIPALISAKKQILQIKKKLETEEYIQYQLDGQKLDREKQEKEKELSDKMKIMMQRNSGNEKMIEQINITSKRAKEKLDEEYDSKDKALDNKYAEIVDALIATNTWEPEIDSYSLELDVADKVQADAEREIKEEAERKAKHYEDLAKKLEEQAHYEDLADKLEEQAHYEDLAAELEAQAKMEREQDEKEHSARSHSRRRLVQRQKAQSLAVRQPHSCFPVRLYYFSFRFRD